MMAKFLVFSVMGLALLLAIPVVLMIAGGVVVLVLGIIGFALGAVFFALLGASAIFWVPLLLILGLVFGFFSHPLIEIVFVGAVLYVLYRWWQHQRTSELA
jgi:hypothetical protein